MARFTNMTAGKISECTDKIGFLEWMLSESIPVPESCDERDALIWRLVKHKRNAESERKTDFEKYVDALSARGGK